MTIKNQTTRKLLRLAKGNETFREELVDELRRVNAPRDFAVDRGSQQALLAHLEAGDVVRITYEPKEKAPRESVTHAVLFNYDPAQRGVELAGEGDARPVLQDRGEQGVVFASSARGRGYGVLEIKHVRSHL